MKTQTGFSLLELTLSMSIAAVVISQTLSIYSNKITVQNHQIAQLRLNQETRAIMGLVSNDLRRHGYWQGENPLDNPHAEIFVSDNCLIVSYDKNKNGSNVPASNETIGYRLNNGKLQTRNNAINCSEGRWEALNEVETVKFNTFKLSKNESPNCINLSHTPHSSCNPVNCDYQAYHSGDRLMKNAGVSVEMSAYLVQKPEQKIHLETHVNLANPIIITATSHGPAVPTNQTCS